MVDQDFDEGVKSFLYTLPLDVVEKAMSDCATLELGGIRNRSAYVMGLLKGKIWGGGG